MEGWGICVCKYEILHLVQQFILTIRLSRLHDAITLYCAYLAISLLACEVGTDTQPGHVFINMIDKVGSASILLIPQSHQIHSYYILQNGLKLCANLLNIVQT